MLIGCITGPDFETAKRQIAFANALCDGIELREDLLESDMSTFAKGLVIFTDHTRSKMSTGKTISTYHNYEETPENLEEIFDAMPPADFYKISTFAKCTTDALRMLVFAKNKPHVAGMCMGPLGQITRILSPCVDNPFTFAAIGKEAAPGQLQAQELIETYNFRRHDSSTEIFGLIGNPIEQSPSHKMHNAFFKERGIHAVYVKMLLEEEELPLFFELAKQLPFRGLSVTMPFKEKLFGYVDEVEERELGAINTLTFGEKIMGANTDGQGALDALGEVRGKRCVILGAGGAAKAIAFEARKRGADVTLLSRRLQNLENVPEYDILINATPVACPIDLSKLLPRRVVMDINIGHRTTPFLLRAKSLGCRMVYGLEMFERQAHGQFLRWFNQSFCLRDCPQTAFAKAKRLFPYLVK